MVHPASHVTNVAIAKLFISASTAVNTSSSNIHSKVPTHIIYTMLVNQSRRSTNETNGSMLGAKNLEPILKFKIGHFDTRFI